MSSALTYRRSVLVVAVYVGQTVDFSTSYAPMEGRARNGVPMMSLSGWKVIADGNWYLFRPLSRRLDPLTVGQRNVSTSHSASLLVVE